MLLSAADRDTVHTHLQQSQQEFFHLLDSTSPAQWLFQPEPGIWSIAQNAAHIIEVESLTVQRIEQALAADPLPPATQAEIQGRERRLLRHVPDRSTRVKAPASLESPAIFDSPTATKTAFLAARAQTLSLLDRPNLNAHGFPHFVFGTLSCFHWLIMIALHARRHCLQCAEIAGHRAFPRE